jgi:hypothetical protein
VPLAWPSWRENEAAQVYRNREYARCASLGFRALARFVILQSYNARHQGDFERLFTATLALRITFSSKKVPPRPKASRGCRLRRGTVIRLLATFPSVFG